MFLQNTISDIKYMPSNIVMLKKEFLKDVTKNTAGVTYYQRNAKLNCQIHRINFVLFRQTYIALFQIITPR